jgi:hypothetical protein
MGEASEGVYKALLSKRGYIRLSKSLYRHVFLVIQRTNMDLNDLVEMDLERYQIERAETCARDDIGNECICKECINDLMGMI